MLKAVVFVTLLLGVTAVLAALDEEHTFSADYLTVRLRRNSLLVTHGKLAESDPLEEFAGNSVVREARRSRKHHRRGKKSRKGKKAGRNKRPKKYEDDSNELSTGEVIPWHPVYDLDEGNTGQVTPLHPASEEQDEVDDAPQSPIINSGYATGGLSQSPSLYIPDFEDDDTDGC